MNAVRILAPFGLSAVLFVLAYLSSRDRSSDLTVLYVMAIILAVVGVVAIFSDKRKGN